MDPFRLSHINAMPSPTWHRLHMNEAEIELPGFPFAKDVVIEMPEALRGEPGAFYQSLTQMEHALKADHLLPTTTINPTLENDNPLERLALSAMQQSRIDVEVSGSLEQAYTTGMGMEAYEYLRDAAGKVHSIVVPPHSGSAEVFVRIPGVFGAANMVALDVVVAQGSELFLHLALDTPEPGTGAMGVSLRMVVENDARAHITSTQTADDPWLVFDDAGIVLGDRARLEVEHTVLGAGRAFTGMAVDLRGDSAQATITTHYLGRAKQTRDLNYIMYHHGMHTTSVQTANGVLSGASEKTLRGTIDFIRGCKGASGQETEAVLLTDDRAINRSIPIILCGEDDVMGNHGGTIGHTRADQLFYLQSRGLSPEAADQLFLRATLEGAVIHAPDDQIRQSVLRLGSSIIGNDFEEVFL